MTNLENFKGQELTYSEMNEINGGIHPLVIAAAAIGISYAVGFVAGYLSN